MKTEKIMNASNTPPVIGLTPPPIKLTCEVCGRVLEHKGEMIFGLCAEHIVTVFDEEQGEAKQS